MFDGDGWRQRNGVVYGTCAKKRPLMFRNCSEALGNFIMWFSITAKSGNRINVLKRRATSLFQRKVGCLQPHKMAMCRASMQF